MNTGELGTTAVLKIHDGTTLHDVSSWLDSTGKSDTVDQLESTTFGDTRKKYVPGLGDGTIALAGNLDPTIDGILASLEGKSDLVWNFYPFGDSGGAGTNVEYSGTYNLSKYNMTNGGPNSLQKFDAELQMTGTVTRALV